MSVETEDTMRCEGFLRIPLTRERFAIIDTEDYAKIADRKWYALLTKNRPDLSYAVNKPTGSTKTTFMQNLLLDTRELVDHRDGDGLNNRRANLRVATHTQNNGNRRPNHGTGFKGVYWERQQNKYRARIGFANKTIHIGFFDDRISAAQAYDQAALKYYGEFARLNFPEERESSRDF